MTEVLIPRTREYLADLAYSKVSGESRWLGEKHIEAPSESRRKSLRKKMREEIEKGALATAEWESNGIAQAEINSKKETLAARHVEACSPLQAQIHEIDEAQTARVRAHEPLDEKLVAKKRAAQNEIAELNALLESKIGELDKQLAQL